MYKVDLQEFNGDNVIFIRMLDPINWDYFNELLESGIEPEEAFERIFVK